MNNIDNIVKILTSNFRFVWFLKLLNTDKVRFKKYTHQFENLSVELKLFQDSIYKISDEFMETPAFINFTDVYNNK